MCKDEQAAHYERNSGQMDGHMKTFHCISLL